jgi:hypothetical protein
MIEGITQVNWKIQENIMVGDTTGQQNKMVFRQVGFEKENCSSWLWNA